MPRRNERKLEVRIASELDRSYSRNFQQATRQTQSLDRQLEQASRGGVTRFNSSLDIARSRLSGFVAVAAAATAGRALVGWAIDARESANALGESINAVEKVFEEAAPTILEFGPKAAQSVGLAQSEFNALAVPIGSLLRNFGFSAQEAAEGAVELTQRAADLASVFNTDVSEALEAIQAALRGESDPIERFGGSISAARVEAFLLSEGLVESKNAITDADKVTGRYRLILEDTARVAGDFADTADQDANSARIFAAELENVQARVGQKVIPAFQQLRGEATDLLPVLEAIGTDVLPVVVDAFGDFIAGVVAIGRGIADLPDGVKAAAAALLGLGSAAAVLYANPVIAGLALVAAGIAKIGDTAREQKQQIDDLRNGIESLNDTGNTNELFKAIGADIEEAAGGGSELLSILRELGVSQRDLIGFTIGEPEAVDKVSAALERVNEQARAVFESGDGGATASPIAQRAVELGQFGARLGNVADRYQLVNDEVEKQRRLERDLADPGEFADKQAQAQARYASEVRYTSEQLAEQKARTEELKGAVDDLAQKYAGELRSSALSFFDVFEQAPDVEVSKILNDDGEVVSSGINALLSNAQKRADQIQRFLLGIGQLEDAGLSALSAEFQKQGPQALGDLEAVLADLDAGGAKAFALEETLTGGQTAIDDLTSQLGAELAAKKEPLLAEFQAFGIDLGDAISKGLDSVSFSIDVDAAIGSVTAAPTRAPRKRERGGRVNPLEAYIVGEREAEVFVPDRAGSIVPSIDQFQSTIVRGADAGGSSGGSQTNITVMVDARGATDPQAVANKTRRAVAREQDIFNRGQDRRL